MVVFEDGLARKSRVPPLRHPRQRGPGRHRLRCTRSSAGGSAATSTSGQRRPRGGRAELRRRADRPRRPAGRGGSPTRRSWSSSTAARRRSRPPRARSPSSASTTSRCRAGQAAGGGVAAGRRPSGHPAAHQRGPLPAAAGARRGAPVRDHLPPAAAVEAHDGQRPRRRPRARPDPPQGAAQALRLAEEAAAADVEEIAEVPGIGPATAEAVVAALSRRTARRRSTRRPASCSTTSGRRVARGERATRCDVGTPGWRESTRSMVSASSERRPDAHVEGSARAGGRHRHVRRRPQHGGARAGGPRLLRGRQPPAAVLLLLDLAELAGR